MQYSNNMMDYPNMEFPYKYTKNGQKELLDKYLAETNPNNQTEKEQNFSNQNSSNHNTQNSFLNQNNQNFYNANNNNNNSNNNNNNGNNQNNGNFNILSALTNMLGYSPNSQNVSSMDANKKGNFDITKLLPLLLNKNLKSNDLINLIAPMLGNQNLPLKDLFNSSANNKNTELPKKEPVLSAGYKKVE